MDEEILQKICAQDEMIAELYEDILEKTNANLVINLSDNNSVDFFFNTLKMIVEDEKRHIRLVIRIL